MQVARIRTSPSRQQWLTAIDRAWSKLAFASASAGTTSIPAPSLASLGILYGMLAIETGRDPKTGAAGYACWCWNLGNVRWTAESGLDWCVLSGAPECVPNEPGKSYPPDPLCGPGMHSVPVGGAFRAYPNLEDGALGFLEFLQKRYPSAWAVLNTTIEVSTRTLAEKFVRELKSHGYFTGPESIYAAVVAGVAVQFPSELKKELASRMTEPAPGLHENMDIPESASSSISTTDPQTPISKSSISSATMKAMREVIEAGAVSERKKDIGLILNLDAEKGNAVNPIRAGEGEHTPKGIGEDENNDPANPLNKGKDFLAELPDLVDDFDDLDAEDTDT